MNPDAIATELLDALDRNTLLAPITAFQPGFDVEAAYGVSAEILRRRGARASGRSGARSGSPIAPSGRSTA
jgi:hypothetical protein